MNARIVYPAATALAALVSAGAVHRPAADSQAGVVTVYKDRTCDCCSQWIAHLRSAGFKVEATELDDLTPIKRRQGVPRALESCHTAVVNGYVIEGHVPADLIKKFLAERSTMAGLAVPGMPIGAPGMEGARVEHYDVVAFDRSGKTAVYAKR